MSYWLTSLIRKNFVFRRVSDVGFSVKMDKLVINKKEVKFYELFENNLIRNNYVGIFTLTPHLFLIQRYRCYG